MIPRPLLVLSLLAPGVTRIAVAQDPVKLSPKMYKVLFENEHVRVLEFRAKPGESEPMHSHPAITVYVISGDRVKVTTADGNSRTLDLKPGMAAWSPAVVHRWENVGTVEAHEIVVEQKSPKP